MKRSTFQVLALAPMLWLCSTSVAQTNPAPDPGLPRLIAYLLDVFYAKQAIASSLEARTTNEPELRTLTAAAMVDFDLDTISSRMGQGLSQSLSSQDAQPCVDFVESANGAALRSASRQAGGAQRLMDEIHALPPAQQRAIEVFLSSDCSKRTLAFLVSPEGKRITADYGKDLACGSLVGKHPDKLRALKQRGLCADY